MYKMGVIGPPLRNHTRHKRDSEYKALNRDLGKAPATIKAAIIIIIITIIIIGSSMIQWLSTQTGQALRGSLPHTQVTARVAERDPSRTPIGHLPARTESAKTLCDQRSFHQVPDRVHPDGNSGLQTFIDTYHVPGYCTEDTEVSKMGKSLPSQGVGGRQKNK